VGCSDPSSLLSPDTSAGVLKEGLPRSGKNDTTHTMGVSRVFRSFPHRHCKIECPGITKIVQFVFSEQLFKTRGKEKTYVCVSV
jgi:hypothetical protein